jgi:hypothetical protein
MRPYTFYLFERGRDVPNFEFVYCGSDKDAEDAAHIRLAREAELVAVQIFNGGDWRRTLYN